MGVSEIPVEVDFTTQRVRIHLDSPRVYGWNEIDAVGLVDQDGLVHWAVHAEASTTYATGPARSDAALLAKAHQLGYVDDTHEGRKSLAASGHAVSFERTGDGRYIEAVQIYASRYGTSRSPDGNFNLYVMDDKFQVLAEVPFAYGIIGSGPMRWYTLRTPSIEVPERFHIGLGFDPHRTKGIFLGFDESVASSHSLTGLPGDGYTPVDGDYDWMVRAYLRENPSGVMGLQRLAGR